VAPPVGRDTIVTLRDDRVVPVWLGGDPEGAPVLFHSATPSGRYQAMQMHEAAYGAGVRLISFDRPGYGTAPTTPPGLASVGLDARTVRGALGIREWAVAGISGGGPYAIATAAAEPDHVSRAMVLGGVGPWAEIDPGAGDPEELRLVRQAWGGDLDGALEGFAGYAAQAFDGLLERSDAEIVEVYFAGSEPRDLGWLDATARERWAFDARDALAGYDGYVRDNLSWPGRWDVDLAAVRCPVALVYGDRDRSCPPAYGEWYARQLPTATMTVREGAGHGTICFTDWSAHFAWLTG